MPRYLFHILDGQEISDPQGDDLPDDDAARRETLQVLGEVLHSRGQRFWEHRRLEVRTEAAGGRVVMRLVVREEPAVEGSRH